jgi:integrase
VGKVKYFPSVVGKPNRQDRKPTEFYHTIMGALSHRAEGTRKQYLSTLRHWSEYLGADLEFDDRAEKLIVSATYAKAQTYLAQCKDQPAQSGRATAASVDGKVSLASVRHRATVLHALYTDMMALGLVESSPFARCVLEYKRHKGGERRPHEIIPADKVHALLEIHGTTPEAARDAAILHLLLHSALRRHEVVNLNLADVQQTTKGTTFLRLRKTKSQKIQNHPLDRQTADRVHALIQHRLRDGAQPEDPLFTVYLSGGVPRGRMSDSTVYRTWKLHCARVGLSPDFSPHAARVTAITRLLDQGYSHREVKELSRHGSVAMVERYDRKRSDIDDSVASKIFYGDEK